MRRLLYLAIFCITTNTLTKEILPSKYDLNASNINFQGTSRKFKYEIRASTLSNNSTEIFGLTNIEGIFDDQKQKIYIYSDYGNFDQKNKILDLHQKVRIIRGQHVLTSNYARLELSTSKLYLKENVELKLEQGNVKAEECTVLNDFKDAKCLRNIEAHMFSKTHSSKVLITSKKLGIKDEGKIFKFLDDVQGVSTKYILHTNNLNLYINSHQGNQEIDKALILSPFKLTNNQNQSNFMTGCSADYDGKTHLLSAKKNVKIHHNSNLVVTDIFKVQIK